MGAKVVGPRTITEAALRRRWCVLLVTLVLLALAGLGAARLRLDFSSQTFYAADPVQAEALAGLHARWGPDDARMFVLARADDERGVLTAERLRSLDALSDRLARVEGVAGTWSVADFGAAALIGDSPSAVWMRGLLVPLLLSRNGDVTVLVVELHTSSDDPSAAAPVVERVREHVAGVQGDAGLAFELAGVPVVRAAFHELAIADQLRLQPVVYAMMALLLWGAFRRLHGVVVPLVAAGVPVALLVGAMGWAGEPVGLLNQAYFTLIPVIAAADAVHWVARFHEELRAHPGAKNDAATRREAIARTGASVGRACGYTAATTAAGFLSLTLAGMPVLRSFGAWAALGIALSYAVTMGVVPVLLSLVRREPTGAPVARRAAIRAGSFATRHPRLVVVSALAVCAIASVAASRIVVDNRLGDLLDGSHPARRASELVDERLGGTLSLEIELRGSAGTWDQTAAAWRALAELEGRLAQVPEVRAVVGPATLQNAPPFLRAEVLDPTRSDARVRAFVADTGGRAFEDLARRVESMVPVIPGVHVSVTGTTRMAYAGVNRIADDLRVSLVGLLVVVTVVFGVLTRSVRLALATLPVNGLPLLVGVAVVGASGQPLDPLAIVVLTVGLGLAVDDTIHLVLRARERGGDPTLAIGHAVATTGRAAVLTSLVLAGGLAVDLLSSFPPLRMLGGLGGATILVALAADMLLLPALVAWCARRAG